MLTSCSLLAKLDIYKSIDFDSNFGTPYLNYTPGNVDGEFIGWYSNSELTEPLDITVYPEESFTIYGKIIPDN